MQILRGGSTKQINDNYLVRFSTKHELLRLVETKDNQGIKNWFEKLNSSNPNFITQEILQALQVISFISDSSLIRKLSKHFLCVDSKFIVEALCKLLLQYKSDPGWLVHRTQQISNIYHNLKPKLPKEDQETILAFCAEELITEPNAIRRDLAKRFKKHEDVILKLAEATGSSDFVDIVPKEHLHEVMIKCLTVPLPKQSKTLPEESIGDQVDGRYDFFAMLPYDLVVRILSELGLEYLGKLQVISSGWAKLLQNDFIWRPIIESWLRYPGGKWGPVPDDNLYRFFSQKFAPMIVSWKTNRTLRRLEDMLELVYYDEKGVEAFLSKFVDIFDYILIHYKRVSRVSYLPDIASLYFNSLANLEARHLEKQVIERIEIVLRKTLESHHKILMKTLVEAMEWHSSTIIFPSYSTIAYELCYHHGISTARVLINLLQMDRKLFDSLLAERMCNLTSIKEFWLLAKELTSQKKKPLIEQDLLTELMLQQSAWSGSLINFIRQSKNPIFLDALFEKLKMTEPEINGTLYEELIDVILSYNKRSYNEKLKKLVVGDSKRVDILQHHKKKEFGPDCIIS